MSRAMVPRNKEQAVSRLEDLPNHPLAGVDQLEAAFEQLAGRVNLITPVASVDHIMPMHQVSLRAVHVDATVDNFGNGTECYRDARFCKQGEVALGKNALSKLMGAAGAQIVSKTRLDDRSDPNYCEIEVVLAVRDFDGTFRQVIATKEVDFRNGAPETLKPEKVCKEHANASCRKCDSRDFEKTGRLVAYEDTALADKRRHIQSLCETKAIERGLRLLFSLKQKYTVEELKKPFVVPKLVANLDPNDPDVKGALIQHALHSEQMLYGAPAPQRIQIGDGEPSRVLRAVPPQSQPQPQTEAARSVDTETDASGESEQESDDMSGIEPLPPEQSAPEAVCTCPCDCQKEISKAVEEGTINQVGSPRCAECYPGSRFNLAKHKDLKTLGLKLRPTMTPAQAAAMGKK